MVYSGMRYCRARCLKEIHDCSKARNQVVIFQRRNAIRRDLPERGIDARDHGLVKVIF